MATLCGMPVPAPGRRSRANSLDGEADFYRIAAEVAAGNFIRGSFATATGLRRPARNDLVRRRATTLGLPQVRQGNGPGELNAGWRAAAAAVAAVAAGRIAESRYADKR